MPPPFNSSCTAHGKLVGASSQGTVGLVFKVLRRQETRAASDLDLDIFDLFFSLGNIRNTLLGSDFIG